MRRASTFALASGFAAALLVGAPAFAIELAPVAGVPAGAVELAPQVSAESLLGADVHGDNWTVAPLVRSDGFVWIFTVNTSYGVFQVNGLHRMKDRVQELRALEALEKMSRSKAFGDALVAAGLAPIRFGRDLVLDPFETVGNVFSGVGNLFSSVLSAKQTPGGGRDPFFDSVTGITKAERELALALGVDPYSDFTPLRKGLEDVAQVTAVGGLPVTVGISLISGGAGMAISSASTASKVSASKVSATVYSHTAREVFEMVAVKLKALGVDAAMSKKFTDNVFYSPADAYAIAESLEGLGAADAPAFIDTAANAGSFDAAKFSRYRAELLAQESARLGTLKDFVLVSGLALNRDAAGRLVAAFPFDTLAWTDPVASSFTRLSADIAARHEALPPLVMSAGGFTPTAQGELKTLGWQTQALD